MAKVKKESLAIRDLLNSRDRREIEIDQIDKQIELVRKNEAEQAKAQAAAEKAKKTTKAKKK